MIDSFAFGHISVFQFRIRMNFTVTGVRYFAVFMDGFAFTEPGEHKINNNSGHQAYIDQERYSQPAEPYCGLHFPGNAA